MKPVITRIHARLTGKLLQQGIETDRVNIFLGRTPHKEFRLYTLPCRKMVRGLYIMVIRDKDIMLINFKREYKLEINIQKTIQDLTKLGYTVTKK